jgi:hypothetical protein
MRIVPVVALSVALIGLLAGAGGATSSPAPRAVYGTLDPHSLDLADLVPSSGRADGVWFVPAGRTRPQVAIVWQRREGAATSYDGGLRFNLTLWNPEGRAKWGSIRWVPHRLVRASPYPISLRLADVTHDGHADLLVDIIPLSANDGYDLISVFATFGRHVRRIYENTCGDDKYGRVCGRAVIETHWGARHGLLWFNEPRGGQAVCCPDYSAEYSLRWTQRGWRTASHRLVRIRH